MSDQGPMSDQESPYDVAASEAVELGNRLAEEDQEAHLWDIADGLLAGAIQYWLYARQPCGDPRCEECTEVSTAEERLAVLRRLTDEYAHESEYYHTPTDSNVGRA